MPRRWVLPGGDLDHRSAAARADVEPAAGEPCAALTIVGGLWWQGRLGDIERSADLGKLCASMEVGQEPEMTDATEAIGQHVHEEATNELGRIERHHTGLAARAVVLPAEADAAIGAVEETSVGDGDAMSVPAEIVEDDLRSSEGALGIDDPLEAAHRLEMSGEGSRLCERREVAEELQVASGEGCLKAIEE